MLLFSHEVLKRRASPTQFFEPIQVSYTTDTGKSKVRLADTSKPSAFGFFTRNPLSRSYPTATICPH